MNESKPFLKSKTIWFNGIVIGLAILGFFKPALVTYLLELDLDTWIQYASFALVIIGLSNVGLRTATKKPLRTTTKKE